MKTEDLIITNIVDGIIKTTKDNFWNWELDYSFLNGKMGIATLHYYDMVWRPCPEKFQVVENMLVDILTNLEKVNSATFCNGLSGILLQLDFFVKNGLLDFEERAFVLDAEMVFEEFIFNNLKIGNWDLLHGAIGVGLYFLYKKPQAANRVLHKMVDLLYDLALFDDDGIYWLYTLNYGRIETKNNLTNLGLSHGIPAIIIFLSKCFEAKINTNRCKDMVGRCINWLLKRDKKSQDEYSYPSHFEVGLNPDIKFHTTRLAWCYGDLGVGLSYYVAGNAFANENWINIGVQVLEKTVDIIDPKVTHIIDAGFCHGSVAPMVFYQQFYKITKNKKFKEGCDYWYNKTLEMFNPDLNSGFKYESKNGWDENPSLLSGLSGTGLSLLGYQLGNQEWSKCLLFL